MKYTATVELDIPSAELTPTLSDILLEPLAGLSGVLSTSERGHVEATITVDAESILNGILLAAGLFSAHPTFSSYQITKVSAQPSKEFERG